MAYLPWVTIKRAFCKEHSAQPQLFKIVYEDQYRKFVERTASIQKRKIDRAQMPETQRSSAFWPEKKGATRRLWTFSLPSLSHSALYAHCAHYMRTALTLSAGSVRSVCSVRSLLGPQSSSSDCSQKLRAEKPIVASSASKPCGFFAFWTEADAQHSFDFELASS